MNPARVPNNLEPRQGKNSANSDPDYGPGLCLQATEGSNRLPSPAKPNRFSSSQDFAEVAHSSCDPLAIKIFEKRDGMFSRDPGKVFKTSNVNL